MLAIFDSIDRKTGWHDAQGAEANADGELWQVVKLGQSSGASWSAFRSADLSLFQHHFRVGDSISLAYNCVMQISLEPDLEARLNQIASEAGKAANQVVEELVANYIDHDAWFQQEVNKGLLSLRAGKFLSHEDVRGRIDKILASE